MLNRTPNPSGLDLYVDRLQVDLWNKLSNVWNPAPPAAPTLKWESWGRVVRNQSSALPEVLAPNGKDYVPVLQNDKCDVVSFFGCDLATVPAIRQRLNVHLVFFVRLPALQKGGGRPTEAVHTDVLNAVGKCMFGFHFQSVATGMDAVLKEYRGALSQDKWRAWDMQPCHLFRINFFIAYNPNFKTQPTLC